MNEQIDFKEVTARNNPDWKQQARQLAQSRTPFVVSGFSFAFDIEFYEYLKVEYHLQARFEQKESRAYFWPIFFAEGPRKK